MPKLKTKSSAKKRFKVTGTGRVKFRHAFTRHILSSKTSKQKRRLGTRAIVKSANMGHVRDMLCLPVGSK